jgi:hypothetical protein
MRASGLDWHGSRPTSVVYLQCQGEVPKDSFPRAHRGRHSLTPSTWIENSAIPLQPTLKSVDLLDDETLEAAWEAVESAVQVWRRSQVEPGNGH